MALAGDQYGTISACFPSTLNNPYRLFSNEHIMVGRSGYDVRLRLFVVCLSVCLQHSSKTNDQKVFKLGMGNDLGISCK